MEAGVLVQQSYLSSLGMTPKVVAFADIVVRAEMHRSFVGPFTPFRASSDGMKKGAPSSELIGALPLGRHKQ